MRKKPTIFILFILFLSGCYSHECERLRNDNRQSLNKLTIGMTKESLIKLMGEGTCENSFTNTIGQKWIFESATNPYRSEILQGSNETFEVLYYYTDVKKADGAITDDELTPLVFKDKKLIGWGWSFLGQNIEKYEIRIR